MFFNFDSDKLICTIKLTGLLTRDQILHAFDAAVSHINYKTGMGRLWDFREADLRLMDTETIRSMAQYSLHFSQGINDVKVAFLVKRDLELGFSNMFKAFGTKTKTPIQIYKSEEDAIEWLRNDNQT